MKINSDTLDVFKEISNIGSGTAATSLSDLMGDRVDIGVASCRFVPFANLYEGYESPEQPVVGVLSQLSGDLSGMVMMIQTLDSAMALLKIVTGEDIVFNENDYEGMCKKMEPMMEICNILISHYVTAISDMTGMSIVPSVPALSVDMVMAMMSVPAALYGEVGDAALYMESHYFNSDSKVTGRYYLAPTLESYDKLLTALGMQ